MNTLRPNPARFDGHWLRRAQMAALLGVGKDHLDTLRRQGQLPPGSYARGLTGLPTPGRWVYDAGAVLRWRQEHADRRRR